MDRDNILLTPGPLTTTLRTKLAMLRDWGSWDSSFNEVTAKVRASLLRILNATDSHVVVPLQGSGTFSVEAAIATLVPRDGHVLVLDNGAYCKRAAKLTTMMGRRCTKVSFGDDEAISAAIANKYLEADTSITHVLMIHCETGTGVVNPLHEIALLCASKKVGLIIDAMSSFAALPIDARTTQFDALIAASGKCLEGVPGMGFVFIRKAILAGCEGKSQSLAMDLFDQYQYMEKTGQWRFTPPTHVVVALAEAIAQFEEEGGQAARLARYTKNYEALITGMMALGFKAFLDPEIQAPIIVTFHAPADARYEFKKFYETARKHGFILYPGKLTQLETFRVGCIGAIDWRAIEQAVHAIALTMKDLGIVSGEPKLKG
jgi:2-aminoethylphosphonate-pyruvate transaminase